MASSMFSRASDGNVSRAPDSPAPVRP
jgi:hypothetical protein